MNKIIPSSTKTASAKAATPSPRPVNPNPSEVVPDTLTGPPTASDSTFCASSRRFPTRGALPTIWTDAFPSRQPAS